MSALSSARSTLTSSRDLPRISTFSLMHFSISGVTVVALVESQQCPRSHALCPAPFPFCQFSPRRQYCLPPRASQTSPNLALIIHGLNQQGFLNSPSCNQNCLPDHWLIALNNSKAVSQDTAAMVEVIAHVASAGFERWHPK